MKKILFLIQLPPPVHGVSVMNKIVFESKLIQKNIHSVLLELKFSKNFNDLNKTSFSKFYTLICLWFKFIKTTLKVKPDFVYFTIFPTGKIFFRDLIFVVIIKIFRIKPIYHIHGKGIDRFKKNKILLLLYKFTFSNSIIIHLSDILITKDILPLKLKKTKLFVVSNGIEIVDTGKYIKRNNTYVSLLFLSHTIESKGIYVLLEAFDYLVKKGHNIKLDIVGYGGIDNEKKIKSIISNKELDNYVIYNGALYGEEKNQHICNADLLVFPTLNDAFGLVILEAMQFSIPVIASDEGSIPEIIDDNKTGLLVEKGNVKDLAEKIEQLINNPDLILRMGKAAQEKFEKNYTLKHFEN